MLNKLHHFIASVEFLRTYSRAKVYTALADVKNSIVGQWYLTQVNKIKKELHKNGSNSTYFLQNTFLGIFYQNG